MATGKLPEGCGEPCREFLLAKYAECGIEATVTILPPLVDSGYEPLNLRCPHDVLWFAEPTGDQRAKWARERTP